MSCEPFTSLQLPVQFAVIFLLSVEKLLMRQERREEGGGRREIERDILECLDAGINNVYVHYEIL